MRELTGLILITLTAILFNFSPAAAQQRSDSLKVRQAGLRDQQQRELNFYKSTLKIDAVKAGQVAKIQEEYKTSMKSLEGQTVSLEVRRQRIRSLMEKKNRRLGGILTDRQQDVLIAPAEPRFSPGSKDSTGVN